MFKEDFQKFIQANLSTHPEWSHTNQSGQIFISESAYEAFAKTYPQYANDPAFLSEYNQRKQTNEDLVRGITYNTSPVTIDPLIKDEFIKGSILVFVGGLIGYYFGKNRK